MLRANEFQLPVLDLEISADCRPRAECYTRAENSLHHLRFFKMYGLRLFCEVKHKDRRRVRRAIESMFFIVSSENIPFSLSEMRLNHGPDCEPSARKGVEQEIYRPVLSRDLHPPSIHLKLASPTFFRDGVGMKV